MATGNDDCSIEDIQKELNCPICLEQFKDPKVLQCLHTFCRRCLEKLTQKSGYIACPVCRKAFKIPSEGFGEVPVNFIYKRVIDILGTRVEKPQQADLPPCGNCDESVEVKSYCFGCECFLCDECLSVHSRVKAIKDSHRVKPLSEMSHREMQSLISQSGVCREHLGNKLLFFCLQCHTPVCQECVRTRHKKHSTKELHEISETCKAEMEEDITKAEVVLGGLQTKKNTLDNLYIQITKETEEIKELIHRNTDLLIQAARCHEETMTTQLENYKGDRLETLTDKQSTLNDLIHELQKCLMLSREVILRGNPSEIIDCKTGFVEQLRELSREDAHPNTETLTCVKASYSISKDMINSISACGKLLVSASNPKNCLARGEGLNQACTARGTVFNVVTQDSQGQLCYSEIDDVKVSVQSTFLELTASNIKVLDKKTGIYDVSYVPEFPGNHKVHVTVKDADIFGSPFDVQVGFNPQRTFGNFGAAPGAFCAPTFVGVDDSGEFIAIVDSGNNRIQLFNKDGEFIRSLHQFYDDGVAVRFESPAGVAFNRYGNLVAVEQASNQIFTLDSRTGNVLLKFGDPGTFNQPCGVFLDANGKITVCDTDNDRIQVFSQDGTFLFKFGENCLEKPEHCVYHRGRFIVSDTGNHCLKVFDETGGFLYQIGSEGRTEGQLYNPSGIAIYKDQTIIVCDYRNDRLQVFTINGHFVASFGTMGKSLGQFSWPEDVVVSRDNVVFVTDSENNRVHVIK